MSDAHERVVQQVREAIPPSYLYQADGYLFRAIEAMVRHIDELEAREGAYGRDVERQVAHETAQKLERAEARIRELEAQTEYQWPNTVLELNKRITELQMRLGRVRAIARAWDQAATVNRATNDREDPYTRGVADTLMQCSGELEYELRQGEP